MATIREQSIRYYLILLAHVVVLAVWLSSPFFLRWEYVAIVSILYYLQFPLIGGCILTKLQFKGGRNEFLGYYSQKFGLPMGKKFFRVVGNTLPLVLVLIAALR